MGRPFEQRNILIVGNAPGAATSELDLISETGVDLEMRAVQNACLELGCKVETFHVGNPLDFPAVVREKRPDFVFNLCEGLAGDSAGEMNFAAMLELIGVAYTGATPLLLGVARDKDMAKKLFRSAGLNVPSGVRRRSSREPLPDHLAYPLICKPACEDASLGISANSLIRSEAEFRLKTDPLLERYSRDGILIEEYIDGREFNVAVIGNGITVRPLEVSEIDFSRLPPQADRITTYAAKWLEESDIYKATPSCCPAQIGSALKSRIQSAALAVYRVLEANAYGRVDLRVDRAGKIYVLEYNPNPDITPGAGFAKALAASGISYGEFVGEMLLDAAGRRRA
ncbi:MAG: ATP-grasp domain-containing protein [Victivallaceae bacterium]|nr:ATP-grasp domain-containing protein [Victivallaceae bacterium]